MFKLNQKRNKLPETIVIWVGVNQNFLSTSSHRRNMSQNKAINFNKCRRIFSY